MVPPRSPSGGTRKSSSTSTTPQVSSPPENQYVRVVAPGDVLLGRGSTIDNNNGNISFREIVRERKAEYRSTLDNKVKHQIACDVIQTVFRRGGRFLRKLDSISELAKLGLSPSVDLWVTVDESAIMSKVKQALREKESAKSCQGRSRRPGLSESDAAVHSPPSPPDGKQQATADSKIENTESSSLNQDKPSVVSQSSKNHTSGEALRPRRPDFHESCNSNQNEESILVQHQGQRVSNNQEQRFATAPSSSANIPNLCGDDRQSLRRLQNQESSFSRYFRNASQPAVQRSNLLDRETLRHVLSSNLRCNSQHSFNIGDDFRAQPFRTLLSTSNIQNQQWPILNDLRAPLQPNNMESDFSHLDIFALANTASTSRPPISQVHAKYLQSLIATSQTPADLSRLILYQQIMAQQTPLEDIQPSLPYQVDFHQGALGNIQSTTTPRMSFERLHATTSNSNTLGRLPSQVFQASRTEFLNQESLAHMNSSHYRPPYQGTILSGSDDFPGFGGMNQLSQRAAFRSIPHSALNQSETASLSQGPTGKGNGSSEQGCFEDDSTERKTANSKGKKRQKSEALDEVATSSSPESKRGRKR